MNRTHFHIALGLSVGCIAIATALLAGHEVHQPVKIVIPAPWGTSEREGGRIVLMDTQGDCRNPGSRFVYFTPNDPEEYNFMAGCWMVSTDGVVIDWKGPSGFELFPLEDFGKTP
jgi:hypothetical protein